MKVRADFAGGRVVPLLVRRGARVHRVERVNAWWEEREGSEKVLWFSVSVDSGDVFRLSLRSEQMVWRLESVVLP